MTITKNIGCHDQFFKEVFSHKDHTIDLLNYTLPAKLKSNLDLVSLELENTSYVDEDLHNHFSDLVYSCNYKNQKIKVSLLFEHKSSPDKMLPIQLNRYMIRIWEALIKQNKTPVPIVPIVFYHGKRSWQPEGIISCFKNTDKEIERYIPDFDYVFIDLSNYSINDIKNNLYDLAYVKLCILVLKHTFYQETLEKYLKEFFGIVYAYFDDPKGLIYLEIVLKYIYKSTEINKDIMINALKTISHKGGDLAMTTAEKLIAEGLQQGLQQGEKQGKKQGRQEAQYELICKMLENGISIKEISKMIDIPADEIKDLLSNNKNNEKVSS